MLHYCRLPVSGTAVEKVRDNELWRFGNELQACFDARCSFCLTRLFDAPILLVHVRVVANYVQGHGGVMVLMIIPQRAHPLAFVRNLVGTMLHLVAFEEQSPPWHGNAEIDARGLPILEGVDLNHIFANERDLP